MVDTTNFTDKTRFRGSSENLHVIERFTARRRQTRFSIAPPLTIPRRSPNNGRWNIRSVATARSGF